MKNFNRLFALAISAFAFLACNGTVDPDNTPEQPEQVPEGVLRIFADKTEITADGEDAVTFRVMFGAEDVSNAKTLQIIREFDGEQKYMAYGANRFSTTTAGTYTFSAKYYFAGNNYTDNSVQIEAKPFFTGDAKKYKRRFLGTLLTSTGCNSCPLAAKGLKDLQAANPGEISIAAFHADMTMPDPMTIPETYDLKNILSAGDGLPAFYWNYRVESYTGGAYFTESFAEEKEIGSCHSGVAIETAYDESSSRLDVTVGITSNTPARFRYVIILVEDNIPAVGEYEQNGQNESYIHYNAVRDVLTSVSGDKINDNLPFTVGVEVKASKSVAIPSGWKAENMRVIAAGLTSEDGGYNWTVNNVNECKVGESAPYIYAE